MKTKYFKLNSLLRKLFAFFFIGYFGFFSPISIVLAQDYTNASISIPAPRSTALNTNIISFGNVGIGSTASVGVGTTVYNPTPTPTVSPSPVPSMSPSPSPVFSPTPIGIGNTSPIGIGSTSWSPSPTPSPASRSLSCENYGDVTRDGVITQADIELVMNYYLGKKSMNEQAGDKFVADVNGDNAVNVLDSLQILRYLNNEISAFDVCKKVKATACSFYGDATGDGKVTSLDVAEAMHMWSGYTQSIYTGKTYTSRQTVSADVDGNSLVTMLDATRILRYLNGEISSFTVCDSRFISITRPNDGSDHLVQGLDYKIVWSSRDIDQVKIAYSEVNGSLKWITPTPVSNTGFYTWKVDVGNTSKTQFLLTIIGYKNGVEVAKDQSDYFFNVNPKLEITNVSPTDPKAGDIVTITGKGFDKQSYANLVYVGDTLMPTQFNKLSSDGKILSFMLTTETPFVVGNKYPVRVKVPNGPQLSSSINITFNSPTVLNSVTPSQATVGAVVTLKGSNFGKLQGSVFLNDLNNKFIATAPVQSWSDNTIQVKIPDVVVDKEYLIVVNGSYTGKFIYSSNTQKIKVVSKKADLIVISALPSGQLKAGQTNDMDIVIKNIGEATAFAKPWSNVKNTIFVSVTTARISDGVNIGTCSIQIKDGIAPGQTVTGSLRKCAIIQKAGSYMVWGSVDSANLVEESSEGNNNYVSTFEVINPIPKISSVTPNSGISGSISQVTGSDFGSSEGSINFYNQSGQLAGKALITGWSDGIIKFKVPSLLKGAYTIEVQAVNGTKSNRMNFTVMLSLPVISLIAPTPLKVGNYMIISGNNFGSSGKVNFYTPGSKAASASAINNYWSHSLIITQIPSSLKPNLMYGIQVRTLNGADLLDSPLVYRYISK